MCSTIPHDDELSKRKCLGLKNFWKKVREKFGEFGDSRSRMFILIKTVMIKHIYSMLIMFRNGLGQMQMSLVNFVV